MSMKDLFQTVVLVVWLLVGFFWVPIRIGLSLYIVFLVGKVIYYADDSASAAGWELGFFSLLFFLLFCFVANYRPAKSR